MAPSPFIPFVLVVMICGCSARNTAVEETSAPTRTSPKAAAASAVVLAQLPASDVTKGAAAAGRLRLDRCAFIETEGAGRLLLAFQQPVSIGAQGRLEVGSATFADGDAILVGGSMAKTANLRGRWKVQPAAACEAENAWLVGSVQKGPPAPP